MQLSILLLATDRAAVQPLVAALSVPGHGVTVTTRPDETVAAAPGYSLVVIDQVTPPATVGDVVTMLRVGPETATIPVLAVAQTADLEERIALLEAGADDVIAKPFDQPELVARVEALSLRALRRPSATDRGIGDQGRHRLVSVFSPKGGVGTTTMATNLALIAAEHNPNEVVLIDLDLSFGQVASHMNIQPKQTLVDLSRDEAALHETDLFRTYSIHHASGVHIIAAPPAPGFTGAITAEHIDLLLARAMEAYEIVVVDAGTTLDERLMAVFGLSDTVIVPVIPEIPALNSVHLLLDLLSETEMLGSQTVFVLNNIFARDLLKRADVETALGARISAELPYDPIAYLKAANEGVPLMRGARKSTPADALRVLAAIVFGSATLGIERAQPARKDKRGLLRRR